MRWWLITPRQGWRLPPSDGYEIKTITHKHFGPDLVKVFAVKITL